MAYLCVRLDSCEVHDITRVCFFYRSLFIATKSALESVQGI